MARHQLLSPLPLPLPLLFSPSSLAYSPHSSLHLLLISRFISSRQTAQHPSSLPPLPSQQRFPPRNPAQKRHATSALVTRLALSSEVALRSNAPRRWTRGTEYRSNAISPRRELSEGESVERRERNEDEVKKGEKEEWVRKEQQEQPSPNKHEREQPTQQTHQKPQTPPAPHPTPLSDSQYHTLADAYIETLISRLEEIQEFREDLDCEYSVNTPTFSPPFLTFPHLSHFPFFLSVYQSPQSNLLTFIPLNHQNPKKKTKANH